MSARGFRNNNPGNLRHGLDWQGLEPAQLDKDFCQFVSPEYGIRALAMLLLHYWRKDGRRTIRELVSRYAPASENDCGAYCHALEMALGVPRDEPVDWTQPLVMRTLVKAIIKHENGSQPYRDLVIEDGLRMAGLYGPVKETV